LHSLDKNFGQITYLEKVSILYNELKKKPIKSNPQVKS